MRRCRSDRRRSRSIAACRWTSRTLCSSKSKPTIASFRRATARKAFVRSTRSASRNLPGSDPLSASARRGEAMNIDVPIRADASDVTVAVGEDHGDIGDAVRRICAQFPGPYWRDLEAREAYPSEFVRALTQAGFLGALIPEEYGGSGLPLRAASVILEEIHASGCNAAACHAQMYIMG